MVEVRTGVVNEFPVASKLPPEAAAYHSIEPADGVAPKVTVPEPHRLAGVVETIVGASLIVATTADLVLEGQLAFTACT